MGYGIYFQNLDDLIRVERVVRRDWMFRGSYSNDLTVGLAVSDNIIPYLEMCRREGASLQQAINFALGRNHSVILMSVRNSPIAIA